MQHNDFAHLFVFWCPSDSTIYVKECPYLKYLCVFNNHARVSVINECHLERISTNSELKKPEKKKRQKDCKRAANASRDKPHGDSGKTWSRKLGHRSKVTWERVIIFQDRCTIDYFEITESFVAIGRFLRKLFAKNLRGVTSSPVPARVNCIQ